MRTVDRLPLTVDKASRRETRDRVPNDGSPRQRSTVNGQRIAATALFVTVLVLWPQFGHACPVCFGDPNSPMTKGTSNAILFLLGIVGVVQVGFIALFWSFWRRAKAHRKFREQFHVIEGGVH